MANFCVFPKKTHSLCFSKVSNSIRSSTKKQTFPVCLLYWAFTTSSNSRREGEKKSPTTKPGQLLFRFYKKCKCSSNNFISFSKNFLSSIFCFSAALLCLSCRMIIITLKHRRVEAFTDAPFKYSPFFSFVNLTLKWLHSCFCASALSHRRNCTLISIEN